MTFWLGLVVAWFVLRGVVDTVTDAVLGGQHLRTHEVSLNDVERGR